MFPILVGVVVVPVVGSDECAGEGDFDVPINPTSHLVAPSSVEAGGIATCGVRFTVFG